MQNSSPMPYTKPFRIHYSRGENKYDNRPKQYKAASFDEFEQAVFDDRGTAKHQQYICSAFEYGAHHNKEKYPDEDHYRLSALADSRAFLALDCDGFDEPDTAKVLIEFSNAYRGFGYQTSSHTPEAPRLRFIFMLGREVTRDEGIVLGEAFQALIESDIGENRIEFDDSVYRAEQPIYLPLKNATFKSFNGDPINVDEILSTYQVPEKSGKKNTAHEYLSTPNHILTELKSYLDYIEPSFLYNEWIQIGMIIHKETGGSDEGLFLWDQWSCGAVNYEDGVCEQKWKSFTLDGKKTLGIGTLRMIARKNGWEYDIEDDLTSLGPDNDNFPPPLKDRKAFSFTQASDLIRDMRPASWLVEGYIEQHTLTGVFGKPSAGKSFVAVGIACSVATGSDWVGNPTKQGAVFYIAGEGHNGMSKRFAAWSEYHGISLEDVPLYKSDTAACFCDAPSAQAVVKAVQQLVEETGETPALIIIDTLARNFGGGDENSTQDMSKFIQHIDMLKDIWSAAVIIVHHTGHSNDNRARGSSVLTAALDHEYQINKKDKDDDVWDEVTMECTKTKDGPDPKTMAFEITTVMFEDAHGRELSSAALEYIGHAKPEKIELTTREQTGLDILKKALKDAPEVSVPGYGTPIKAIKIQNYKKLLIAAKLADSDKPDSHRTAARRVIQTLNNHLITNTYEDLIWIQDTPDKTRQSSSDIPSPPDGQDTPPIGVSAVRLDVQI